MFILALILVTLLISPLVADDSLVQVGWNPNNYKVVCRPPDACIYSESVHKKAEILMPQVVDGVRQLNFKAPAHWGKRVGKGTADDHIELYESEKRSIASTSPYCPKLDLNHSFVQIGSDFTKFDDRDYLLYYFMAHELFHVLQSEYPFYDQNSCANVPGWIYEGTATAVGQAAMRKRYTSVDPEIRDERVAGNFAGMRRYDKPLPDRKMEDGIEIRTGEMDSYRTSSFWRHLAEAHYKGRYDFLSDYMKNQDWHGDWVAWLRNNVELGTGVHLGMVFGGFLADYAGWGDDGYSGMYFGRRKWLYESFTGCETLYLNKTEAADYVDVDLKPLTGKCIEVRVSAIGENGLAEGQSAAIQVAAIIMSGPPSGRNGLHLSMAASTDKEKFHCAREVKRKGRKGLGRCLFVPDDGKIRLNGGSIDARVWNVFAQEKGDPPEQRQEAGEGKGELVNLYTVSYTPISVSSKDTKFGGVDPITARFYFALDVTTVEFDGQKPASSGAGKKRTVGSLAEGSDPQTTLPKQDAGGQRVNSFSLPEQFRPNMPSPPTPPELVPGQLSVLIVGQELWEGDSDVSDTSSLAMTPLKRVGDDEYEPYPLSVGETGDFPVSMVGSQAGEPLGALSPGSLQVDEFTDLVFRARYSGALCRHKEMKPDRECPNPISVSGQMVKAFAGSRLAGHYMVVERTEGTEMYRKANEQGLAEWSESAGDSVSPGSGPGTPGTSQSTGGALDVCTCTCEERAETLRLGDELKSRMDSGEKSDAAGIMSLMRCQAPCQREYMICIMEENERKKEEEQALLEKSPETVEACECSCDTLKKLTHRQKKLEAEMQSGISPSTDEIMSLSNCFQSCMNEFMSCPR